MGIDATRQKASEAMRKTGKCFLADMTYTLGMSAGRASAALLYALRWCSHTVLCCCHVVQ